MEKRKKVCLVTINDLENYGNRLQNFALQYFLEEELHCSVRTLWPNDTFSIKSKIFYCLRQTKWRLLATMKCGKYECLQSFFDFNKSIKMERALLLPNKDLKKIEKKYDFFVVGSDQVFSEKHCINLESMYLPHICKQQKICYAGSFGTDNISDTERNLFEKYYKSFSAFSLREIPKEIKANHDIFQAIDPVFLVSKIVWSSIGRQPKWLKSNSNFVFVYWLGEISEKIEKEIKRLSASGLTPVICNIYADAKQHVSVYNFIWLIEHSSVVITNSFHGTALAIIFNKRLISVPKKETTNKENMDIRFRTLKETFELSGDAFTTNESKRPNEFDWNHINEIIEFQKKKTIDFFISHGL